MSQRKNTKRSTANAGRAGAKRKRASGKVIAGIVAVAVLLVAAIIAFSIAQSAPTPAASTTKSSPDDMAAKGSPDSKVTIVEYSDFQCPYCARFSEGAGRQIDQQYVQTGKVRMVYKNLARIGQESIWAAEAAFCAGDQGQFWQYHDKLFASQAGENRGAFAKANLQRFAQSLNLDSSAFNSCLDSDKYGSRVANEGQEAKSRGVTSTPTFFVGKSKVEGALPFEVFRAAIETELQNAK